MDLSFPLLQLSSPFTKSEEAEFARMRREMENDPFFQKAKSEAQQSDKDFRDHKDQVDTIFDFVFTAVWVIPIVGTILFILTFIAIKRKTKALQEQSRDASRSLEAWAQQAGVQIQHDAAPDLASRFGFLSVFPQGGLSDSRPRNARFPILAQHRVQGRPATLFEYRYTTRDDEGNTSHHRHAGVIIELPKAFAQHLIVSPEGLGSFMLKRLAGVEDIDFESAEFSKAFLIAASDRRFAFDIVHQGLMDYLLRHRNTSFELSRHCLMVYSTSPALSGEEAEYLLRHASAIADTIPSYLLQD